MVSHKCKWQKDLGQDNIWFISNTMKTYNYILGIQKDRYGTAFHVGLVLESFDTYDEVGGLWVKTGCKKLTDAIKFVKGFMLKYPTFDLVHKKFGKKIDKQFDWS